MNYKRLTLLCGHYGSGKTNIAVNMALDMKKRFDNVTVADLDIVNPYFRTKDSNEEFKKNGIRLIVSEYANSNLDIPALPDEMYALTDDKSLRAVIDVGGDDRGALALGRLAPKIIEENDYDMLMVINKFRPLTPDAKSTVEVMREIEQAGGIRFTGIINNSNLGDETTENDVLNSVKYADEVSALSGLPVVLTTARKELYNNLNKKIDNLFSLTLQAKPID
jgi:MinD-like ATPase involved in chromosome partitioning or flagellar assembly